MNTFTQLKILNISVLLCIIIYTIIQSFESNYSVYFLYTVIILTFISMLYSFKLMDIYSKNLIKTNEILTKVANGDLYHRITGINKHNIFGKVSWNINNLLDQVETFNRDIASSMKAISTDTNRVMLTDGLHGDFITISNDINTVLKDLSIAQSKDQFIQMMLVTLNSYANGDYRSSINLEGMQEDIILLAKGINNLGESLSDLSYTNYKNGINLQKGSNILSENISILNNATNSQAASLEETAAALEEITQSMKESNNNTNKMTSYAKELISSAKDGEILAQETSKSMESINNETKSISEAILIIDQIAFQTNILSLNAAVEAATAGEAGKGFAVVAGEVRNLASRSANAAKEIKAIVESANIKTSDGKENASKMIDGYIQLNEKINLTINLLQDVAYASKEQEEGIIQINEAVSSLDKNTQESAKIAQETNDISKESFEISQKIISAADKEFVGKEELKQ